MGFSVLGGDSWAGHAQGPAAQPAERGHRHWCFHSGGERAYRLATPTRRGQLFGVALPGIAYWGDSMRGTTVREGRAELGHASGGRALVIIWNETI